MTGHGRPRGLFEAVPRRLYRVAGPSYLDALTLAVVLNGIAVAVFGLVALLLFLDASAGELAAVGACSAAGYVVEGLAAGLQLRRAARPAGAWLAGERGEDTAARAWSALAALPLGLVRQPGLLALGVGGAAGGALVLATLLELPAGESAFVFPTFLLLYVSSLILRYVALDLAVRPLLEHVGRDLPGPSPGPATRVSLHGRLVVTVPMVTWGSALITAGLLTDDTRDLDTIGTASVVSWGVSAVVSMWLSLVLADAVSRPIVDLRDAMRRVRQGDLSVRTPVVSTDETGELAASFNAMVVGLDERERLRDAFGAFVDPALTERVLAEGTDLRGEETEASVLFLDVRRFTEFAERATAQDVVACLNELYEAVVPVIQRHGGHVNKFVGDGLLAVFGTPERHVDHAPRAVAAAREIAALVRSGEAGTLGVGLGVNSGRVVAGTIGGGGRRDFTVVGDVVNTASRVEAATRETGDDLLITDATRRRLDDAGAWVQRPGVALKGKTEPVRVFAPA